jgi:hypothetical protein
MRPSVASDEAPYRQRTRLETAMNRFRPLGFAHPLRIGVSFAVIIVAASFALRLQPAAAQMEFDYNGDGKVTCADFKQQFPDTFTDEATKALQQFPDDLSNLNNDPKEDNIACESQGASSTPATDEATPTSEPAAPAPVAVAPAAGPTERVDVPDDVMARVEGCAVIAISSRDVVGAGCPGVGAVAFRIPDGAPSMQGTIIMNSGAGLPSQSAAPETSSPRTPRTRPATNGSNGSSGTGNQSNETADTGNGKQDNSAADTGNGKQDNSANSGKSKDTTKKGKHKNKHKHGKNKKKKNNDKKNNDKNGKKSKKQGKQQNT